MISCSRLSDCWYGDDKSATWLYVYRSHRTAADSIQYKGKFHRILNETFYVSRSSCCMQTSHSNYIIETSITDKSSINNNAPQRIQYFIETCDYAISSLYNNSTLTRWNNWPKFGVLKCNGKIKLCIYGKVRKTKKIMHNSIV